MTATVPRRGSRAAAAIAAATTGVVVASSCSSTVTGYDTMPPYANPCAAEEPPSGVAVPAGNLPGWRQIFVDEFDRCELGGTWSTYSGNPGGNPHSLWDGSMVETGDGTLALRARRDEAGDWITGGVSNYPVTQLYGRWEIRMRADHSDDISYHMLLWPQNEQWPPEIDFAESVSGDRSEMDAFLHWVGADGENDKASAAVNGDFSDWHTVGVEWLPGLVRYLLDGRVWAEVRSAHMVPTVPMWLGMQAEAGACERRLDWGLTPCDEDPQDRPDTATVEIDWVTVYAPDEAEIERMTRNGEFDRTESAVRITDD